MDEKFLSKKLIQLSKYCELINQRIEIFYENLCIYIIFINIFFHIKLNVIGELIVLMKNECENNKL